MQQSPLVKSLEATSAGRLQRYLKTTAAQQSKAKQNIPEPKPPGRNDLGNAPVQEVHQLPADAVKAQVRPHTNPQAHATTNHLSQHSCNQLSALLDITVHRATCKGSWPCFEAKLKDMLQLQPNTRQCASMLSKSTISQLLQPQLTARAEWMLFMLSLRQTWLCWQRTK